MIDYSLSDLQQPSFINGSKFLSKNMKVHKSQEITRRFQLKPDKYTVQDHSRN